MLLPRAFATFFVGIASLAAQDPAAAPTSAAPPAAPAQSQYPLDRGTIVPLSLINSVSTRHSLPGDRVYLETAFPVLSNGRIVIPVGSYVAGTVTEIKKPGRVKGHGELYVRFDSLTLPNGVTRDFRARIGGMDGNTHSAVDRREGSEGKVIADGDRSGDARTVADRSVEGLEVGGVIGAASGHPGLGVGVGAAAGAAAGLIAVLITRGPDAVLARGTTVEMVLDRPISFNETELNFGNYQPPHFTGAPANPSAGPGGPPLPPLARPIPK